MAAGVYEGTLAEEEEEESPLLQHGAVTTSFWKHQKGFSSS